MNRMMPKVALARPSAQPPAVLTVTGLGLTASTSLRARRNLARNAGWRAAAVPYWLIVAVFLMLAIAILL